MSENKEEHSLDSNILYKPTCLELFNIPFRKYKNKNHKEKSAKDLANPHRDYDIFCDIIDGLEIVGELIKYAVWYDYETWNERLDLFEIETPQELYELETILPKNIDDLEIICKSYPWVINDLSPEIYNILNLENYELMCKLFQVKKFLYFNTFPELEDATIVLNCEDDTIELWLHIKTLVKKLMVHHLKLAKTKQNK
jgi:hypothetical protein